MLAERSWTDPEYRFERQSKFGDLVETNPAGKSEIELNQLDNVMGAGDFTLSIAFACDSTFWKGSCGGFWTLAGCC